MWSAQQLAAQLRGLMSALKPWQASSTWVCPSDGWRARDSNPHGVAALPRFERGCLASWACPPTLAEWETWSPREDSNLHCRVRSPEVSCISLRGGLFVVTSRGIEPRSLGLQPSAMTTPARWSNGADGGDRTRACALRGRRASGNTSSTWSRLEDSNLDLPVIGQRSCQLDEAWKGWL